MSLSQLGLATRVGAWLSFLPILLRTRTLPQLLNQLAAARQSRRRRPHDLEEAIQVVDRVCRLRIFSLPMFPESCLRRSLALYYFLGRSGHPIEIHIGVRKDGSDLNGHSWVTLGGRALRERNPAQIFNTIYSYDFDSGRSKAQAS